MKEKIKEKLNKGKDWWADHKDKIVKLGLAGGMLYLIGYVHATNKILDNDRVIMESNQEAEQIEVIDM